MYVFICSPNTFGRREESIWRESWIISQWSMGYRLWETVWWNRCSCGVSYAWKRELVSYKASSILFYICINILTINIIRFSHADLHVYEYTYSACKKTKGLFILLQICHIQLKFISIFSTGFLFTWKLKDIQIIFGKSSICTPPIISVFLFKTLMCNYRVHVYQIWNIWCYLKCYVIKRI